jgi:oligopeptide/dipeptide ABC transporter ATP-binding protein
MIAPGMDLPQTAREPLISVRGLHASYRSEESTIPAVRDVSLDLFPGEILALVGESAAGKSTVAHAILGLLPSNAAVEGDVRYLGRSLLTLPSEEFRQLRGREIAMIFQDAHASLTPTMTIGAQMAELYRAHRHVDEREAWQAGLEMLGEVLPDPERIADAYPFQISGGMAQRVMVAMATALGPRVIIADEPTANLDPAVRVETLQRLEALRDGGAAVLVITHDFGVVARVADRVGVMYAGQIIEEADAVTIFRRPRHPYTYGLLQSLPSIQGRGRLQPMRGQPPDLATLGEECPFLPRCAKGTNQCRVDPAPHLVPVEGSVLGHRVACFNPMVVDRADEQERAD